MRMKTFTIILIIIIWVFIIGLLILPYGSLFLDYSFLAIPMTALGIFYLYIKKQKKAITVIVVLNGFLVYFLIISIGFRNDIAGKSLEGKVIKAERSDNHNHTYIEVLDKNGDNIALERISEDCFKKINVDDQLDKEVGIDCQLNGETIKILDESILDIFRIEM